MLRGFLDFFLNKDDAYYPSQGHYGSSLNVYRPPLRLLSIRGPAVAVVTMVTSDGSRAAVTDPLYRHLLNKENRLTGKAQRMTIFKHKSMYLDG